MSISRSIVVILCDQLRPDFLSAYGGKGIPTPNIDRLASMGVTFDKAITQSTVCAPARASMMTGRYVSDHGVWTNDVPFRDGLEYLPERMNQLGYRTGAFGKLHHFPADDAKGFSVAWQMEEGRLGEKEPYLAWLRERHPEVTKVWNIAEGRFAYPEAEYHEHWIADRAIEFIGETPAEDPFLAWISFQGPHTPLDPPAEVVGSCDALSIAAAQSLSAVSERELPDTVRYRRIAGFTPADSSETMSNRIRYCELIVEIDAQIGRILKALEDAGRLDSTTILFSADHGDLLGDFDLKTKGPYPYPGQMDIPLILANHPDLEPATRSDALVGNIDIPGTCLALAGDDEPIGYSASLLDTIGRRPRVCRPVIFCEFCDSVKTVDNGRFRLSYYPFEGVRLLFDRATDPGCTQNLAGTSDYADLELDLMGRIVDSLIVAKGPRVEAHDFVPAVQEGLSRLDPGYRRSFPAAFPLTAGERAALEAAELDADYNEFCREKPVLRQYAPPYWQTSAES